MATSRFEQVPESEKPFAASAWGDHHVWFWGSMSLGLLAAYKPAGIWAANLIGIPHPDRLILMASSVLLVDLFVWWIAVRAGSRPTTALGGIFLATLLLVSGGGLASNWGTLWSIGFVAGVTVLVIFLLARIGDHALVLGAIVAVALYLATGPVVDLVGSITADDGASAYRAPDPVEVVLQSQPDILLVVFDGYAANTLYRENLESIADVPILDELEGRGFASVRSAWTSYPTTTVSVASLLDLNYSLDEGATLDVGSIGDLYRVIGGESRLIAILESNGYETTMIESGWSGSNCGPKYDRCISSAFLDEPVFKVLEQTMLRNITLDLWGYAFTAGSLRTMTWVADNMPAISANGQPDFVFAHVMAPHAPFFLGEECELRHDAVSPSISFMVAGAALEERVEAYEQQVACIDSFMLEVSDSIDRDSVVLFVSDHGTDRRNQVPREPDRWSEEDVIERMEILFSIRTSQDCEISDGLVSPSIGGHLLNCLGAGVSGNEVEPLRSPRMFVYSSLPSQPNRVVELESEIVNELLREDFKGS